MKLRQLSILSVSSGIAAAFAPTELVALTAQHSNQKKTNCLFLGIGNDASWISLVNDVSDESPSPVKKFLVKEGDGDIPIAGSKVKIEYRGTIHSNQSSWTVDDVLECWLNNQQGLYDLLAKPFLDNNIDGSMLLNEQIFTEDFVSAKLGVSNKIQCKKTIMAAKRLRKQIDEFPVGTEFDSSFSRGKRFEFVLGKGKVIKAMDMLVSTMKVGEQANIICRSDYGYGKEGYRKVNGDVMIPPYAILSFDITLVSSDSE
jgi:FK506-binding protein 4/5